jgi:hypothetical protein
MVELPANGGIFGTVNLAEAGSDLAFFGLAARRRLPPRITVSLCFAARFFAIVPYFHTLR